MSQRGRGWAAFVRARHELAWNYTLSNTLQATSCVTSFATAGRATKEHSASARPFRFRSRQGGKLPGRYHPRPERPQHSRSHINASLYIPPHCSAEELYIQRDIQPTNIPHVWTIIHTPRAGSVGLRPPEPTRCLSTQLQNAMGRSPRIGDFPTGCNHPTIRP